MDLSQYKKAITILEEAKQLALSAIPTLNAATNSEHQSFGFLSNFIESHQSHLLGSILTETANAFVAMWSPEGVHWTTFCVSPIVKRNIRKNQRSPIVFQFISSADGSVLISGEQIETNTLLIDRDDAVIINNMHFRAFSTLIAMHQWEARFERNRLYVRMNDESTSDTNTCEWLTL